MAGASWDEIIAEAGDGFNRPPEDEYEFRITSAEAVTGKKDPFYEQLKIEAKIAQGPQAGKSIKTFYLVKAVGDTKRLAKFLRQLRVLGISADTLRSEQPSMAQIAKAIEGRPFIGKVKHNSDAKYGDSADLEWGQMSPPSTPIEEVTAFPAIGEAESLGYDATASVAIAEDAAF